MGSLTDNGNDGSLFNVSNTLSIFLSLPIAMLPLLICLAFWACNDCKGCKGCNDCNGCDVCEGGGAEGGGKGFCNSATESGGSSVEEFWRVFGGASVFWEWSLFLFRTPGLGASWAGADAGGVGVGKTWNWNWEEREALMLPGLMRWSLQRVIMK